MPYLTTLYTQVVCNIYWGLDCGVYTHHPYGKPRIPGESSPLPPTTFPLSLDLLQVGPVSSTANKDARDRVPLAFDNPAPTGAAPNDLIAQINRLNTSAATGLSAFGLLWVMTPTHRKSIQFPSHLVAAFRPITSFTIF